MKVAGTTNNRWFRKIQFGQSNQIRGYRAWIELARYKDRKQN